MEKGKGKKVRTSRKSANRKRRFMLTISAVVVAGIAALSAYSLSIKDIVKDYDNKIYPGVSVQGVNLGGMAKEDAKNKLTETFETAIGNKKLSIAIGDKQYELIYSDIIPKYDIDGTVEQAYKFGKDKGTLKRYFAIKNGDSKRMKFH